MKKARHSLTVKNEVFDLTQELGKAELSLDADAINTWKTDVYTIKREEPCSDGRRCFFMETSSGPKRLVLEPSLSACRRRLALSGYLAESMFESQLRPIKNFYGDFYIKSRHGYYYLTDCPRFFPPDFQHEQQMREVAALLASFHQASFGFLQAEETPICLAALPLARELLSYCALSGSDCQLRESFSVLCEQMKLVLELLPPQTEKELEFLAASQRGVCLGAGFSQGVMITSSGLPWLARLETVSAGVGACDLSELLLAIGYEGGFEIGTEKAVLLAYLERRPLPREEKSLLMASLLLPLQPVYILRSYTRGEYSREQMTELLINCVKVEKRKKRWADALLPLLW